ncbi:DUF3097 family protein [Motilibacter rhizosphaerae]|uniref:DUF3097 family protein n=1 Tax=Motilibacter rhizosphaerae TaxID=598652 RepID=A0A4V2F4L5_9ACTN|nr:DUF3097 domain-containing protein [Motilibacter rhizosphaerae]RZS89739.1 DUF3097 family protein [Motilibacter rhizosphaerae]
MLPYGPSALPQKPRRAPLPEVAAELGLVLEDAQTGWCGAVVLLEKQPQGLVVVLEDRHGVRRSFPAGPGFLLEGKPVRLVRPVVAAPASPTRTASGSVAVAGVQARVARGSRIWVEGKHDAELVEKVWGDDLRIEGVVVEMLDGVDALPDEVLAFRPDSRHRLGVLVDHLVPGSKESRIAAQVTSPHVLVLGHPYVDVWQAVRPSVLGLRAWPDVPRGQPWKEGVCAALGWPVDPPAAWRRILGSVRTYADLEPSLLGRVEELIDFVTAAPE